jgi:phosphatidylglycerol:prolipoprotein diacylglycerol transferase
VLRLLLATIVYPQFDPVLVRFGPVAIRWYGLAYLLGFLTTYVMLLNFSRRGMLRIARQDVGDLISWLAIAVMVGGRFGWWFFYHRAGGLEPWYEPIAIWHGGMSFHGGLIAVMIALLLWCRQRRAPFWNVADCLARVTPIALFLGRLANFINAELVGRPTSLPWGVIFPGEDFPRHPSQIYEALLEGPLLLVILWFIATKYRPRDGRIAAAFLILYGLARFAVEFTRQPDPQIGFIAFGWLTMGQALSAIIVVLGAILFCVPSRRPTAV